MVSSLGAAASAAAVRTAAAVPAVPSWHSSWNRGACSASVATCWLAERAEIAAGRTIASMTRGGFYSSAAVQQHTRRLPVRAAAMPAPLNFLLPVGPEDCDCTVVLLPPPEAAAAAEAEAEAPNSSAEAGSSSSSLAQPRETRLSCKRQRTAEAEEGTAAAAGVAGSRLPACSVLLKSYSPLFRCSLEAAAMRRACTLELLSLARQFKCRPCTQEWPAALPPVSAAGAGYRGGRRASQRTWC